MTKIRPPGHARIWVTRRPLVNAWWLEATNQLRCCYSNRRLARNWVAAAVIAVTMSAAVSLVIRCSPVLLHAVAPHLMTVSVLVALQASVLVHRGRRKWTEIYSSNWLSTVPISRRESARMITLRSFLNPLLVPPRANVERDTCLGLFRVHR
jgi:hypothetical protein